MFCSQTGRSDSLASGCGPSHQGECLRMQPCCPSILILLLTSPPRPCPAVPSHLQVFPRARHTQSPKPLLRPALCLQCLSPLCLIGSFSTLRTPFRCPLLQETSICGCHNELPQTGWLKMIRIRPLTVLDASRPNQGVSRSVLPLEALWGWSFLASPHFRGFQGFLGL